ncbi:MAG: hypothetical protein ACLFN8_02560 [Candidatus Woesearchaeota archaeon]
MRKDLLYFALFFVVTIILLQLILVTNTLKKDETQITQARATGGMFSFCLNYPPQINLSNCPLQINQSTSIENNELNCIVQATHPRNHTVLINQYVLNQDGLHFNIMPNGSLKINGTQQGIGSHSFEISAQDTHPTCPFTEYKTYAIDILDINDPPYLVSQIPNVELSEGSETVPFALNDYFDDVDINPAWAKPFTYNYFAQEGILNVDITISPLSSIITIKSPQENCETDYIYFEATDQGGLSVDSNLIKIESICEEEQEESPAGGGGGGAICESRWDAEPWSECFINGTRFRKYIDLHKCEDEKIFWDECEYEATCFDGIQNEHILPDGSTIWEEGIDCGGPCEPCEREQEEEKKINATCFDGIKNCHTMPDGSIVCEEGIDCGGPCEPCLRIETPGLIVDEESDNLILYLALVIVLITSTAVIYVVFRKQILSFIAKIGWWLTRHKRKQFLLTEDQKIIYLKELNKLYTKINNSNKDNYTRKDKDMIYVLKLSRHYLSIALKIIKEFTYEDIIKATNKLIINESLRQGISLYAQSMFPKERKNTQITKQELLIFIQETRMLVMNTTKLTKKDFTFKATEIDLKNTTMDKAQTLIHNTYLALCFSEVISAQKNYHELLELYEKMTNEEKTKIHTELKKIYYYTKTILAWM